MVPFAVLDAAGAIESDFSACESRAANVELGCGDTNRSWPTWHQSECIFYTVFAVGSSRGPSAQRAAKTIGSSSVLVG